MIVISFYIINKHLSKSLFKINDNIDALIPNILFKNNCVIINIIYWKYSKWKINASLLLFLFKIYYVQYLLLIQMEHNNI